MKAYYTNIHQKVKRIPVKISANSRSEVTPSPHHVSLFPLSLLSLRKFRIFIYVVIYLSSYLPGAPVSPGFKLVPVEEEGMIVTEYASGFPFFADACMGNMQRCAWMGTS
jgi:hypothetical protein